MASTLPELLDDETAAALLRDGVPAIAGLATALCAMGALGAPPPDVARLAEIAEAVRRPPADGAGWLAEDEAKAVLRAGGVPVPDGGVVADADDAVAAQQVLGRVALKLCGQDVRHKSAIGAVELDIASAAEVRAAFARLSGLSAADVLVERMAPPGVELLIAARRDGVIPTLVIALGGVFAEARADAAVIALPASAARVGRALRKLRGIDTRAVAELAARVGDLLLEGGYELIELNPVIVTSSTAVAVDALICRSPIPALEKAR
jgi:acetyltransferase